MNPADEFKAAVQLALETRVGPLCGSAMAGDFPTGVVWQGVVNEALETLGAQPGEAGLRNWLGLAPVPEYQLPAEPVREWAQKMESDAEADAEPECVACGKRTSSGCFTSKGLAICDHFCGREYASRLWQDDPEIAKAQSPVWIPQTYNAAGIGHRPELTGSETPVVWRCSVRGEGWCEIGRFPETEAGCADAERAARESWGERAGIVEPA